MNGTLCSLGKRRRGLRCSAWSTRLPERSGGDGAAGDSRVTPVCDQWTEEKRVRKVGEGRVLFITVFHTFTPETHVHRDTVVQGNGNWLG